MKFEFEKLSYSFSDQWPGFFF